VVRPLQILPSDEPWVSWRPGVVTRLHSRAAAELCVFEQRLVPGASAPTHTHFAIEEMVVVLSGSAEVWVDGVHGSLESGESILFPPHSWHGFRNSGADELRTLAIFASALPLVEYEEDPGVVLEIGASGDRKVDAHRSHRGEVGPT